MLELYMAQGSYKVERKLELERRRDDAIIGALEF